MKRGILCLAVVMLAAPLARPDEVRLKNGDRLSGELVRIQGDNIVLKTDLGEVQIPKDKIQDYSSSDPVVVMEKGEQKVEGKVSLAPSGDWQVQTSSGTQTVPAANVVIIYPAKVYNEKGYGRHIGILSNWSGKGGLGYAQVRGDQTSRSLSVDFMATRRLPILTELPERSSTNIYLNMLFANSSDLSGNHISTNNVTGGVREDVKFTEKNFWFVLAQLDHFSTQALDLRQTYGGGLGRDLISRPNMEVQGLAGLTYVDEKFQGGITNRHGDALVGEHVSWKLSKIVSLDHIFTFYPNLTEGGDYHFDTVTGLSAQLSKRIALTTGFTDHYLSNPLPGHRKNQLIVSTGIAVSF